MTYYQNNPNGQVPMAASAPVVIANDQTPVLTNLATRLDNINDSVTAFPFGHSYLNITANGSTTVKSGTGVLHALYINSKGLEGNTATVYDSTTGSGTKIGTIDTTSLQGAFLQNITFVTGLTIVTANGVPADITVAYR